MATELQELKEKVPGVIVLELLMGSSQVTI